MTREFRETVRDRAQTDVVFARALLRESLEAMLTGDLAAGRTVLRDYVNATIGFEGLSRLSGYSAKSLMRMLGPAGNPRAENLLHILECLQRHARVRFKIEVVERSAHRRTPAQGR